ncbi:MAG: amidohydrolase family protein [Pseudobdellovibrionaceae bacterium]
MKQILRNAFIFAVLAFTFASEDQLWAEPNSSNPSFDIHTHLFSPEAAKKVGEPVVTAETIITQIDQAGISSAAIYSDAYFFEERAAAMRENNFLAAEVAKFPKRLIGFCSVNLKMTWIIEEVERCAKVLKMRGLKLHPQANGLDLRDPKTLSLIPPILEKAGELGLPVVFDSVWMDSRITLEMIKIIVRFPKTKVILAHSLFKDYRDLSIAALLYQMNSEVPRNIYVDLSAISIFYADSPERENLVWHLRQFGIDRVLMGSDYPAFTPIDTLNALRKLPFTEAEITAITSRNASSLFN